MAPHWAEEETPVIKVRQLSLPTSLELQRHYSCHDIHKTIRPWKKKKTKQNLKKDDSFFQFDEADSLVTNLNPSAITSASEDQ